MLILFGTAWYMRPQIELETWQRRMAKRKRQFKVGDVLW